MARKSVKSVQRALELILEDQRRDRDMLGKMQSHSMKTLTELGGMRQEEIAKINAEASEQIDAMNKHFDHLVEQEQFRLVMIESHLKEIDGPEELQMSGHNSKHAVEKLKAA